MATRISVRPPTPRPRIAAPATPFDEPFPAPEYPDASWFEKPDWLEPGQRLTITDDGQVAGYFYERDVCLIDGTQDCWQPPPSPTDYAAFHQQDVVTANGTEIRVGVIGDVGGHASPFVDASTAVRHYADPGAQRIVCRAGDDEHGGWIAGALVAGLTYGDVALLRRCALSGDWRPMGPDWFAANGVSGMVSGGYDAIGPTLVNRPGLPLVKAFTRAASAPPVWLGGNGGVQLPREPENFDDGTITPPWQSAAAASTGGTPVKVQLKDGTVVEIGESETTVGAALADAAARTAQPPMPPGNGNGDEENGGEGGDTVTLEQLAGENEQLRERVSALEQVVEGLVEAIAAREQQEVDAGLQALDGEAVALP